MKQEDATLEPSYSNVIVKIEPKSDAIPKLEPLVGIYLPDNKTIINDDRTGEKFSDTLTVIPKLEPLDDVALHQDDDSLSDEGDCLSDEGDSSSVEDEEDATNVDAHDAEKMPTNTALFQCKCGLKFELKRLFQRHVWQEHIDIKLSCPFCQVGFCTQRGLSLHHSAVHKLRLRCKFCDFCTLSPIDLQRHRQKDHAKVFSCNKCSFQAQSRPQLAEHKKQKHILTYTCDKCAFNTNHCTALIRHKKNVCDNISLPRDSHIICKHCHGHFATVDGLLKHIGRKHRELQCCYCASTFQNSYLLSNHQKQMHTKELFDNYGTTKLRTHATRQPNQTKKRKI